MRCPGCEFENPEGMNFCGKCATPLAPSRCRQCGFDNPAGFAFCGQCATPLTGKLTAKKQRQRQTPPKPQKRQTRDKTVQPPVTYTPAHLADRIRAVAVTDGERKTITALFADLKGSTALIEGLDPEEARTVIDPALQLMMDAVHQYDGFVAQALGDGIFALFGAPLAQMDPQIRRRRTFEVLKKLFLRESLNQPLVLIFEDLHWIDGETQGFLDVLSESIASAKILLLTNYRPEYRHEWGQKTYYTQLRLAPFGPAEAEEFLDVLLGNAVGAGLVPAHAGRPQEAPLHIPTTVQAVLAARIDRLAADEKALLQQLAALGGKHRAADGVFVRGEPRQGVGTQRRAGI